MQTCTCSCKRALHTSHKRLPNGVDAIAMKIQWIQFTCEDYMMKIRSEIWIVINVIKFKFTGKTQNCHWNMLRQVSCYRHQWPRQLKRLDTCCFPVNSPRDFRLYVTASIQWLFGKHGWLPPQSLSTYHLSFFPFRLMQQALNRVKTSVDCLMINQWIKPGVISLAGNLEALRFIWIPFSKISAWPHKSKLPFLPNLWMQNLECSSLSWLKSHPIEGIWFR